MKAYSLDFRQKIIETYEIENFWSKVKSILRTLGVRTYEALSEAIKIAFAKVSEMDIRNWFAHCCYCSS
jgi:hypothetical protein